MAVHGEERRPPRVRRPMTPLELALTEWARGVTDPEARDVGAREKASRDAITSYIRDGLGWLRWKDQLTGATVDRYSGNRSFAWCGAFAAWCWRDLVPAEVRFASFASCYRLWELGQNDARWRVKPADIRAGDIIVVGGERGKSWGEHICLALSSPLAGWVSTVEGNGRGLRHGGSYGEGVVSNLRSLSALYRVRHAYRPPA